MRLAGPRPVFDRRVAIERADCVDIGLADSVAAACYVAPSAWRCRVPRTPIRAAGDAAAGAVSELLFGEAFALFESSGDWAFGRNPADSYGGWVHCDAIAEEVGGLARRAIVARVAPVFALPDIKAPVVCDLTFGAWVSGVPDGRFMALDGGGFVHQAHLAVGAVPGSVQKAMIAAARLFMGAPYVWGGRTPLGVDCSGLVQVALAAAGVAAPRDSDQQRVGLGHEVDFAAREVGDLVFFAGHVGMLVERDRLLHANAHWMAVVEEPLGDVVARGAAVIGVRRL